MKPTPKEMKGLRSVVELAIENACSCPVEYKGNGYMGHDKSCIIHLNKADFALAYKAMAKMEMASSKSK